MGTVFEFRQNAIKDVRHFVISQVLTRIASFIPIRNIGDLASHILQSFKTLLWARNSLSNASQDFEQLHNPVPQESFSGV
jgi:hypothetical protein